jgi:hypothetical protein
MEFGGPADPHTPLGEPLGEALWLEPFRDDPSGMPVDSESVELAFVAAVQYLPANQRVALIMFDVLGFSASEIADVLNTTPDVGELCFATGTQAGRREVAGAHPAGDPRCSRR